MPSASASNGGVSPKGKQMPQTPERRNSGVDGGKSGTKTGFSVRLMKADETIMSGDAKGESK